MTYKIDWEESNNNFSTYYDVDLSEGDMGDIFDEFNINYDNTYDIDWNAKNEYSFDGNISSAVEQHDKQEQERKQQFRGNKNIRRPRPIAGGGVLQYPIDLDTNIQDYFEMQIFKYRPANRMPNLNESRMDLGNRSSNSNRRGNRQNQRLQELRSTIQLPIPNSVKDTNKVEWGPGEMSSVAGGILGPIAQGLILSNTDPDDKTMENASKLNDTNGVETFMKSVGDAFDGVGTALSNKAVRRRSLLTAINKATSMMGLEIDVNQVFTRSGAVENTNLELLIGGPTLRSFNFTIRFTPRSPEESQKVRMIIRALKQESAIKYGQSMGTENTSRNYLLGTPCVFKLRYIKARTQKDIKGLNKFKTCALTNMSVDYTGETGRFAAYEEDSQSVSTILNLSFTELLPVYDTDYVEFDYQQDDVGL